MSVEELNTADHWDETYRNDLLQFGTDLTNSYRYDIPRFEAVFELIKDSDKCLEIGCGLGFFSLYCKGRGKEITGCDHAAGAIDWARKNVGGKFFVADAHSLMGGYDAVILMETIEHTPDPMIMLQSVCRASQDLVVLTTPKAKEGMHSAEHFFEYDPELLRRDLEVLLDDVVISEVDCAYGTALIGSGRK